MDRYLSSNELIPIRITGKLSKNLGPNSRTGAYISCGNIVVPGFTLDRYPRTDELNAEPY